MVSAVFLALLAGPPAPSVEIAWDAPASCPDAPWFRERIEAYLDRPLSSDDPPVRLETTIQAGNGSFEARLRIETEGGSSERPLANPQCFVLADALAFIAATVIDPETEPRELPNPIPEPPEPAPPVPEETAEPLEEPPPSPPVVEPTPPRSLEVRGAVRMGGLVDLGLVPGVGGGVELGAALLLGSRWRLGVAGAWLPQTSARLTSDPTVGGDIGFGGATVRGCGLAMATSFEVPLCLGASGGTLYGEGVGIDQPASPRALWFGVPVSAGFAWVPRRFVALWAELTATGNLRRPALQIDEVGVIHTVAPVSGRLSAGVEVRFP